jgi:Tfp pilus assembly protein PilN
MTWNFTTTHSISKAKAEIAQAESEQAQAQSVSREFNRIKGEIALLQKKNRTLEKADSKIDVASVLAEISFLIDERIVLNTVEFKAERFAEEDRTEASSGSTVVTANTRLRRMGSLPLGNVRFKVVISGVATDAGDVAKLICKLEDSPYFFHVIPSFSRTREIKIASGSTGKIHHVSEFEIRCELANYYRKEICFAGKSEKSTVER